MLMVSIELPGLTAHVPHGLSGPERTLQTAWIDPSGSRHVAVESGGLFVIPYVSYWR
jgi:hypothetical protein